MNEWDVRIYYQDNTSAHFIFSEKDAPYVQDVFRLIERDIQRKSFRKITIARRFSADMEVL